MGDFCLYSIGGDVIYTTRVPENCKNKVKYAAEKAVRAGVQLSCVNFTGADLTGADLSGSDLSWAILTDADLSGSDLSGSDLTGANLTDADLTNADFTQATFNNCTGNGREIISAQCGKYNIAYTSEVLQIGCKRYPIEEWWDFSDDKIDNMDIGAFEWWKVWKPIIKQMIEANPARGE